MRRQGLCSCSHTILSSNQCESDIFDVFVLLYRDALLTPEPPFDSRYGLTPKRELIQLHANIGQMLLYKAGRDVSGDTLRKILPFAISHVNMGLPLNAGDDAISFTPSQQITFAKLNLEVGQKAAKNKLDFSFAEGHLKAGISFLPGNSWAQHYNLTLQLWDEYANVSLC